MYVKLIGQKGIIKAQESLSITDQSKIVGNLLDGTDCKRLLGSGATKSFTPKLYYHRDKSLHRLPNFSSKVQVIQEGNGESINIRLIIALILKIQGHMFEIYTMVSEIHDNVDLVLGVKNLVELEGEISM